MPEWLQSWLGKNKSLIALGFKIDPERELSIFFNNDQCNWMTIFNNTDKHITFVRKVKLDSIKSITKKTHFNLKEIEFDCKPSNQREAMRLSIAWGRPKWVKLTPSLGLMNMKKSKFSSFGIPPMAFDILSSYYQTYSCK